VNTTRHGHPCGAPSVQLPDPVGYACTQAAASLGIWNGLDMRLADVRFSDARRGSRERARRAGRGPLTRGDAT
jgi:hypothetical protein